MDFEDWCDEKETKVRNHELSVLTARTSNIPIGRDAAASVVPTHYASEERVAALLARLGKPRAAAFVRNKLPTSTQIRSGDLGEILATEYVREKFNFEVPVNRLRWKDHRQMSMRGDDMIGIMMPTKSEPIQFLKCETKSRVALVTTVLEDARQALDHDRGRPAPHALSYVADRSREVGKVKIADAIDDAQYRDGIKRNQVSHMVFVFCGSNPENLMKTELTAYSGRIEQFYVGLRIERHQKFIRDVYLKVIANANKP